MKNWDTWAPSRVNFRYAMKLFGEKRKVIFGESECRRWKIHVVMGGNNGECFRWKIWSWRRFLGKGEEESCFLTVLIQQERLKFWEKYQHWHKIIKKNDCIKNFCLNRGTYLRLLQKFNFRISLFSRRFFNRFSNVIQLISKSHFFELVKLSQETFSRLK